jgi:hypothetical protein
MSEFEASLVYRVSSRTARAIQRNPVLKNQKNKKKKKKKKKKGKTPSSILLSRGSLPIPSFPYTTPLASQVQNQETL